MAHAILQGSVRMCVGWCGLVCVRSCVLVGMCRQRCALIVARCACACACMSALVNACSSTAGLDLTTSSGDHLARAPATRPRLWCANRRFHPALTCQSAVPEPARVQKRAPLAPGPSGARPCRGFAPLEAKSDDSPTQNPGRPKARAATARALYSTPLPRLRAPATFTPVLLGVRWRWVCVGWCKLVGAVWRALGVRRRRAVGGGGRRRRRGRAAAAAAADGGASAT